MNIIYIKQHLKSNWYFVIFDQYLPLSLNSVDFSEFI